MQSELYVIKLLTDNDEIKAENAKVKAENAKLRQAMEKNEARLAKLEQRNAGRNYKSTTETMLKGFGISFRQYGVSTFGILDYEMAGSLKSQSLEETKFIHAFRCGITGTTGMNSFSRFSSRFLDDSRQFLRFLDDSWTIRNFWMILERGQLLNNFVAKHLSWFFG
ncbi:unnamed protein product [Rhizophagus irregularis]|uniref:Uncharacterized protein n=1 Tax=Rhizophagus irregularis TaxID=588596 RepID=A0A915YX81_9GLOM|nr:unnamed protein product [Rhizophagus irregularis]